MQQNIGGYQPQQQFDITEAVQKKCDCGSEYFNQAFKLGVISGMAPGNRIGGVPLDDVAGRRSPAQTGKDVIVRFEVFLCRECGKEFGKIDGPMPPGDE